MSPRAATQSSAGDPAWDESRPRLIGIHARTGRRFHPVWPPSHRCLGPVLDRLAAIATGRTTRENIEALSAKLRNGSRHLKRRLNIREIGVYKAGHTPLCVAAPRIEDVSRRRLASPCSPSGREVGKSQEVNFPNLEISGGVNVQGERARNQWATSESSTNLRMYSSNIVSTLSGSSSARSLVCCGSVRTS